MKSGPATGAALKAAYQAQLDGEFSDVAGGEQWLQSYLATASTQAPDAESDKVGNLTRAERKAAATALIRQHPDWSNQRLAQAVRMSKNSIAEFRATLEVAGQIEHYETLEGADGKAYPRFLDPSGESQAESAGRG